VGLWKKGKSFSEFACFAAVLTSWQLVAQLYKLHLWQVVPLGDNEACLLKNYIHFLL
jgi:hypothetical protein